MLLACAVHAQNMPDAASIAKQRQMTLDAISSIGPANTNRAAEARGNGVAANAAATLNAPGAKVGDFSNLSRLGAMPSQKVANAVKKNTSDLMIFASMSMPDDMLREYAVQAKRFGAVILLRGFIDDKSSRTRDVLARLNKAGANFEVSPDPFKTFKIEKVPTIVLASADSTSVLEQGCAKPNTYVKISGNISILDALDKISLLSSTTLAADAKRRILDDRKAPGKG